MTLNPGNVIANPELKALTGFRFLAAFYVFLFHVQIRWPLFESGPLAKIIDQGAVGMTMFFMLSGFILTYTYGPKEFEPLSYFKNRIARIYPIYAVAALLAVPYLIYQLAHSTPKFGGIAIFVQSIIIVTADVFMVQAWIPMLFGYLNNSGSWSLSVEALFYLLFVPLVWMLRRADQRALLYVSGLVFVFALMPPFAYYAFDERPTLGLQIF